MPGVLLCSVLITSNLAGGGRVSGANRPARCIIIDGSGLI